MVAPPRCGCSTALRTQTQTDLSSLSISRASEDCIAPKKRVMNMCAYRSSHASGEAHVRIQLLTDPECGIVSHPTRPQASEREKRSA